MTRVPAIALALLLGAPVAPARANPPPLPPAVRRALTEATVLVLPAECGGVLAVSPDLVATALHCIDRGVALRVQTRSGAVLDARLEATDTVSDQAVLLLEHPAAVTPLAIARRRPIAGTVVYFQGNPQRPRPQEARVDRLGRCESLPRLPDALFTSIHGEPGDSGSPLVDGAAEIVGLVHGGARCQIATPASHLGPLVDRVLARDASTDRRGGRF